MVEMTPELGSGGWPGLHVSPTATQVSGLGQTTPKASPRSVRTVDSAQVEPPSLLSSKSALPGSTPLAVVDVVPTATHKSPEQATEWRSPVPWGTDASVQVEPPLDVSAI